ncbi:MAG: DNA-3-methyladenine glycosylase [Pseudomonadota bacterium]|nr:DNA-3-methyladenine glycosylase [Pseudomonadota bacterium]
MSPLPPAFYDRDALEVARDLVGAEVAHGDVRLRITEVEAYRYPGDTANHARMGRTKRNAPMWGAPGHAYVYLCYGLHHLLNFVTGPEGHPAVVLLRAAEPVAGLELVRARRGNLSGPTLLTGPGKIGQALGLDTTHSGTPLDGPIVVYPRIETPRLVVGPRVGIDYAEPGDRDAPWRIALAESRWVSHPNRLRADPSIG